MLGTSKMAFGRGFLACHTRCIISLFNPQVKQRGVACSESGCPQNDSKWLHGGAAERLKLETGQWIQ